MTPMPKGAGGVRCPDCGAHAAADGEGGTITLHHDPGCPTRLEEEGRRRAEDFAAVHHALQALSRAWIHERPPTEQEGLDLYTDAAAALSRLAVAAHVPLNHARHLLEDRLQRTRDARRPSPASVGGVGAGARGREGGDV